MSTLMGSTITSLLCNYCSKKHLFCQYLYGFRVDYALVNYRKIREIFVLIKNKIGVQKVEKNAPDLTLSGA